MHVHQVPIQPDRIQQQPAPKPAENARARAAFEQLTALVVNERPANDRRQSWREKLKQGNAGRKQMTAKSEPAAGEMRRPEHDGGVDILV